MSMQRLSEKQTEVLKLIQEVNELEGVSLDSYKERFESLSYLVSEALNIEYDEYDKIINALEKYGYLKEFELTVDGVQYLEVGIQEKMGTVNNFNFNGNNQTITTDGNVTIDNSVKQNGVIVQGNTGGSSSGGLLEAGTKVIGAVKAVLDSKK